MSGERRALDTNILVYIFSDEPEKQRIALELVEAGGAISVQALNEYAFTARRKLRHSWEEIRNSIDIFCDALTVYDLRLAHHKKARKIAEETGYTIYDSLMLAVAADAGATVFVSEDLQHDRKVAGLTIQNPFL